MKPKIHHNIPDREEFLRMSQTGKDDLNWKDNPFISDAAEGISLLSNPTRSLKKLDKRFLSHNWWLLLSGLTVFVLVGFLIFLWEPSTYPIIKETQVSQSGQEIRKNKIEPSSQFTSSLPAKGLTIKQVASPTNDVKKETIANQLFLYDIENEHIQLSTQPVKQEYDNVLPLKLTKRGKEIYLYNLKTVDYRAYRSVNSASAAQNLLTGTPASENMLIDDGLSTDSVTYISFISASMKDVQKGNYKKALVQFEQILNTYSTDINALFYGGLCLFHLGEYERALVYLLQTEKSGFDNFEEESEWYQLKCYKKLGDHENTVRLINQIKERTGFYSNQLN
jgi:TolA-binding protein